MYQVNIRLDEIFHALSDPYRVRLVRLFANIDGESCLCELAEGLNEPEYKISRHIKILKQVGILKTVREGKWIYHQLAKSNPHLKLVVKSILEFPDENRVFEYDIKRFKKQLKNRVDGRCQRPLREGSLSA